MSSRSSRPKENPAYSQPRTENTKRQLAEKKVEALARWLEDSGQVVQLQVLRENRAALELAAEEGQHVLCMDEFLYSREAPVMQRAYVVHAHMAFLADAPQEEA